MCLGSYRNAQGSPARTFDEPGIVESRTYGSDTVPECYIGVRGLMCVSQQVASSGKVNGRCSATTNTWVFSVLEVPIV